jgi:hypothetical protein
MSRFIYITCYGPVWLHYEFGGDFELGNKLFSVKYFIIILSRPFRSHLWAGLDGWRQGNLDVASFSGIAIRIDAGASGCSWALWAWFLKQKNMYITNYSM